jgi:hypothetical protein
MTQLMEQAIEKASRLSENEQNAIATIMLREIESDRQWSEMVAGPGSGDLVSQMADEAITDVQSGRVCKLDLDEL